MPDMSETPGALQDLRGEVDVPEAQEENYWQLSQSTRRFLHWIGGWIEIAQGLATIFSFGFWVPEWSVSWMLKCLEWDLPPDEDEEEKLEGAESEITYADPEEDPPPCIRQGVMCTIFDKEDAECMMCSFGPGRGCPVCFQACLQEAEKCVAHTEQDSLEDGPVESED